jgi:hypothetical protein
MDATQGSTLIALGLTLATTVLTLGAFVAIGSSRRL